MLAPNRRPMLARLLDVGDRALHKVGLRNNRLSPAAIKAEAVVAWRFTAGRPRRTPTWIWWDARWCVGWCGGCCVIGYC